MAVDAGIAGIVGLVSGAFGYKWFGGNTSESTKFEGAEINNNVNVEEVNIVYMIIIGLLIIVSAIKLIEFGIYVVRKRRGSAKNNETNKCNSSEIV